MHCSWEIDGRIVLSSGVSVIAVHGPEMIVLADCATSMSVRRVKSDRLKEQVLSVKASV